MTTQRAWRDRDRPYLVEVELAQQRAGEVVAAVHGHHQGAGGGRVQQRRQGLEQTPGRAATLLRGVALPGADQLLGQGLLQGQREGPGGGGGPAGVHLQREQLWGGGGQQSVKSFTVQSDGFRAQI